MANTASPLSGLGYKTLIWGMALLKSALTLFAEIHKRINTPNEFSPISFKTF